MFTGCAAVSNNPANTYRQITMDEAVAMMEQESDYIILDVRRPDEFAAGHIPGAINVPNETIGTAEIPELPDKNQLIIGKSSSPNYVYHLSHLCFLRLYPRLPEDRIKAHNHKTKNKSCIGGTCVCFDTAFYINIFSNRHGQTTASI